MNDVRVISGWKIIAILLVLIIIAGGTVIWVKYSRSRAIEISLAPQPNPTGEIYIGGEVNNPGFYSLYADDDIEGVVAAAGGLTDNADPGQFGLIVPGNTEEESPQLVNINRAEAWLLESLPGVGPVKAQAIVEYRRQNGPFCSIYEIMEVDGFGETSFQQIEHLITVGE
jgi:competence protein ComEA